MKMVHLCFISWVATSLNGWIDSTTTVGLPAHSGKSTQVYARCGEVEMLERELGSQGVLAICATADRREAEALALRYGLEKYESPHREEFLALYHSLMQECLLPGNQS